MLSCQAAGSEGSVRPGPRTTRSRDGPKEVPRDQVGRIEPPRELFFSFFYSGWWRNPYFSCEMKPWLKLLWVLGDRIIPLGSLGGAKWISSTVVLPCSCHGVVASAHLCKHQSVSFFPEPANGFLRDGPRTRFLELKGDSTLESLGLSVMEHGTQTTR